MTQKSVNELVIIGISLIVLASVWEGCRHVGLSFHEIRMERDTFRNAYLQQSKVNDRISRELAECQKATAH